MLVTAAVLCVLCFIWYSIGRDDGARKAYVRGYAAAVDSVKALPTQTDSLTNGQRVVGLYDALGVRYTIFVRALPDSVSGMIHLGGIR